jgi:hypothetical protein
MHHSLAMIIIIIGLEGAECGINTNNWRQWNYLLPSTLFLDDPAGRLYEYRFLRNLFIGANNTMSYFPKGLQLPEGINAAQK